MIAIVGVTAAVALLALGFGVGNRQPQAASTPPAATASPTATPTPTSTPSPTPAPTTPTPARPLLPVAVSALGSAISAIGQTDEVSAKAREALLETFEKLVEEIEDGELGKAAVRARELGRDVDKLVRDEKLTTVQATPVRAALSTLTSVLTETRTDPGEAGGGD